MPKHVVEQKSPAVLNKRKGLPEMDSGSAESSSAASTSDSVQCSSSSIASANPAIAASTGAPSSDASSLPDAEPSPSSVTPLLKRLKQDGE